MKESHHYLSVPLFVRPNSIIAMGTVNNKPDYDYADGVELQVFGLVEGASASTVIYNIQGQAELKVTAKQVGNVITVEAEGSGKPWTILFKSLTEISSIEGGTYALESTGIRFNPTKGQAKLILQLK
jgi:alpha-D-xyloside xylohydrolase